MPPAAAPGEPKGVREGAMNLRHWLTHPRALIDRLRYFLWEMANPDKPWLCPGTVRFCERHLCQSMRVLEFGSGRSTIWFARRVGQLTSVEHNRAWHRRVARHLAAAGIANVDYRFVPLDHPESEGERAAYDPLPAYVSVAEHFPDRSLDLVIADGHYRTHCVRRSVPKIKSGGYLLVDDVNRWPSLRDLPVPDRWLVVDDSTNGLKRCVIWRADYDL
jgi:hypothetical protein